MLENLRTIFKQFSVPISLFNSNRGMTRQNITKCISESYYYSLFIRSPCWLDLIIRNIVLLLILNCLPTYLKLIESIETIRIALKIIISIFVYYSHILQILKNFEVSIQAISFWLDKKVKGAVKVMRSWAWSTVCIKFAILAHNRVQTCK